MEERGAYVDWPTPPQNKSMLIGEGLESISLESLPRTLFSKGQKARESVNLGPILQSCGFLRENDQKMMIRSHSPELWVSNGKVKGTGRSGTILQTHALGVGCVYACFNLGPSSRSMSLPGELRDLVDLL